jgi:1-aminocyclopropane-1-carboxylate deaminase
MLFNPQDISRDFKPDFSFFSQHDSLTKLVQHVKYDVFNFDVLRLDLMNEFWGGNKLFKLKENIQFVLDNKLKGVVTFGGANSNHLYATAALCNQFNLPCVVLVRGEAKLRQTSTLTFMESKGATIYNLNRTDYKNKNQPEFLAYIEKLFPDFHIIPEGGNNLLGIKGCESILPGLQNNYDYILCACGTATTFTGIYNASLKNQIVIGISVLKGANRLIHDVNARLLNLNSKPYIEENRELTGEIISSTILNDYAFSGYAAFDKELIEFKNNFETETSIPLDYIYTSKLFYGASDLIRKKRISETKKVLIIHCGGLQGNADYEARYHLTDKR